MNATFVWYFRVLAVIHSKPKVFSAFYCAIKPYLRGMSLIP